MKILTLHSSKGLEFPLVVLMGLEQRIRNARELDSADAAERSEVQQLNRRLLFVAMTRAMKELLVMLPTNVEDPILSGIGGSGWRTDHWPISNPAV
jgi:superfamily I DNA/RNA helicase